MLELSTSVQYIKGIGPRLAEVLGAKGIHTVDDLLHYLPFRYEDRVNPRGISELRVGEIDPEPEGQQGADCEFVFGT